MTGPHDLRTILAGLTVRRRDGVFVYVSAPHGSVPDAAAAIEEDEGTTFVLERAAVDREGLDWSFVTASCGYVPDMRLDGRLPVRAGRERHPLQVELAASAFQPLHLEDARPWHPPLHLPQPAGHRLAVLGVQELQQRPPQHLLGLLVVEHLQAARLT